jgi:hypothetical protein
MDERIEHTGRVPRASRSHTFFQAAGVAEMGGPERRTTRPWARSRTPTTPYTAKGSDP